MEFIGFPKIARLSRECIITEKIDGTNGQIYIPKTEDVESPLYVGSRTQWITPNKDNYGFAKWAYEHKDELVEGLGPGRHFGEWWGSGIQRGYDLPKGEKRFSLFNTIRWCLYNEEPQRIETGDPTQEKYQQRLPSCCSLVPVLYRGMFNTMIIYDTLTELSHTGSQASLGFMKPEGIVVYHIPGNVAFKKTFGNDGHKGGIR